MTSAIETHPAIDILFPYYGDVSMMKKAVLSIINQTYPNWRLLAFDDGYPSDEPEKFFKELIKKDTKANKTQRIFYEKNKTNLGANGNYRKALSKAKSEYYVMMGADDIMHKDYLKHLTDILAKNNDIDIYQPLVSVIDENDKPYRPLPDKVKARLQPKKAGLYKGEDVLLNLMNGAWHYFPAMAWRTVTAKKVGFNTKYDVVQDICMISDIIEQGGSFYFDKNANTFSYRRHSQSDSSVKALNGYRFDEELAFFRNKSKIYKRLGWRKASVAAKLHATSRLNAIASLPKSIKNPAGKPVAIIKSILSW